MIRLQEIFLNCDYFDTVLLYLLGEEDNCKWEELTEIYNNIFHNICELKPKVTDYVFTTLKLVSEEPTEYDFFYTTRKAAFEFEKDEFENTYKMIQFSDSNLSVILGMYVCERIDYLDDEIFLAEILRKIAKYCNFIKRELKCSYVRKRNYDSRKMLQYLSNKRQYYLTFNQYISESTPVMIKNTMAKESLTYFEREICDNEHITGFERIHWPHFILSPVFVSSVKLIWNVLGIFERVTPDVNRLSELLQVYKERLLSDYHNGYTASRNEKIVIEYTFSGDEEIPMIYVINNKREKSELREYSLNRVLSMPIDYPDCLEWEYAGAYLMLYMAYPLMYTRYRSNLAQLCLVEVIKQINEMDKYINKC